MTSSNLDLGDIAEFAQQIHGHKSEQDTVERVLAFALSAVGADHAGIVAPSKADGLTTVATTDPVVEEIDALRDDEGSVSPDQLAALGVHSVLGVPVRTGDEFFGTLYAYSGDRDAFTVDDQSVLHAIARLAAIALSSTRKEQNLWRAIDSRKVVGQAQGILMERFDLSADDAFAVLVRYSQTRNVKVVAIAEDLVESRVLPTSYPD